MIVIFSKIQMFFDDLYNSGKLGKKGFSGRKLSSALANLCILFIVIKFVDNGNAIEAMFTLCTYSLALFGLVQWGAKKEEPKPEEEPK